MGAKPKTPKQPKHRAIYVSADVHRHLRQIAAATDMKLGELVAQMAWERPLPKFEGTAK